MLGQTEIDVERRFFDQIWRKNEEQPIETRMLYLPSKKKPFGNCRLWVDIQRQSEVKAPFNIQPRPKTNLELRIVVWEIWDVPHLDFEDVSDLYVRVAMPSFENMSLNTDTHFRAQNGFGSFNWRIKFTLSLDQYSKPEHMRVNFRIYDKDLLSPDDFYSDVTLDIADLVNSVLLNEQRESMYGEGKNKEKRAKSFVLETIAKIEKKKGKTPAKILVSVDCLTEEEAKKSPVGIGRSDPNQDPFLPSPQGRFQWSLNPFSLLNQLVGPAFRNKFCFILFMIFFVAFMVFFAPGLITTIIGNLIV